MRASHSASGFIGTTAAAALMFSIEAFAAAPAAPASPSPSAPQVSSPESSSDQPSDQPSAWVEAPAAQAQLDVGKVVVQSSFDAARALVNVDAAIRIHATAQTIWPLITQCDSASLLIPGLRHCKELSRAPDGSWAVVEHDIKFAAMLPMVHSVFRADYHAPYRMNFHRIAGDMKDEVGTWLLQPSADGRTTTIEYRVAMQPGFFVPHSMVRRSLKKQLPAALLALRARAEHPTAPLAASSAGAAATGADQTSGNAQAQSSSSAQ
ncbi:MAG TPA: SRPBCC family protein [Steroidobacteraceae bacterium]|nr:SRPBCC family protein [Steroidobacteraceae bacterium]